MITDAARKLETAFVEAGMEIRLVGGCVRDTLIGADPKDLDFATNATPDEMMVIAEDNDFKVIPTGLQHGTVTIVIDDEPFEVTTLRIDTETDGRHAKVEFTTDWKADAARRDLTINAMSMTLDGEVFDYFDGRKDLENKIVRFVGDANTRIQEDFLRILRAFRFAARFRANLDTDADLAIRANVSGLDQISGERIWSEFRKILATGEMAELYLMRQTGVLAQIGITKDIVPAINMMADRVRDPVLLLAALVDTPEDVDALFTRWRFDAETRDRVKFIVDNDFALNWDLVKAMLLDGVPKNRLVDLLMFQGDRDLAWQAMRWQVPVFPVTGQMLLDEGMKPGPAVGAELKRRRNDWVVRGAKA